MLSLSALTFVENSFAPSFLSPLWALQVKTAPTRPCDSSSRRNLASRINLRIHARLTDQFPEPGCQIGSREKPVVAEELGMLAVERFEFVQAVRSDITDTGQPALRKFHPVRVDIPGLHET